MTGTPGARTARALAADTLAAALLAAAICYGGAPAAILPGLPYLGAACVAALCGVLLTARPSDPARREPGGTGESTAARPAILVGWQLALVGFLNIWASAAPGSVAVFWLSFASMAAAVAAADRLLVLVDRRALGRHGSAPGPSKPRRPLRLFFWFLVVYPLSPVLVADAVVFGGGRLRPWPLYPPRLALLAVAIFTAVAAGLSMWRSRSVGPSRPHLPLYGAAALVIALAGWLTLAFGFSLYLYLLSAGAVAATAAGARSLAGTGGPQPGTPGPAAAY